MLFLSRSTGVLEFQIFPPEKKVDKHFFRLPRTRSRLVTMFGVLKVNSDDYTHTGHAMRCALYHEDRLRGGFDLMRAAWASAIRKDVSSVGDH